MALFDEIRRCDLTGVDMTLFEEVLLWVGFGLLKTPIRSNVSLFLLPEVVDMESSSYFFETVSNLQMNSFL